MKVCPLLLNYPTNTPAKDALILAVRSILQLSKVAGNIVLCPRNVVCLFNSYARQIIWFIGRVKQTKNKKFISLDPLHGKTI